MALPKMAAAQDDRVGFLYLESVEAAAEALDISVHHARLGGPERYPAVLVYDMSTATTTAFYPQAEQSAPAASTFVILPEEPAYVV